ncbi:PRC-barrel domain-containing protein [Alteromonas halophila]|uniref:PRC-barrel domain containing protein n=1 Tax=Alteromonas halophila TaxID=516698 RepID=A0A918JP87_9ALTE|nr:PRC-barrel domain-containing protein [Alteromonas halophila]GGW89866.1 hypothetical protein GCM10007391_25240 [Alteromonas halophila]
MLVSFKQLKHFSIHATDGDIGGCRDLLFDDQDFVVRYLVADTNTWLPLSRKVVISPISVTELDLDGESVHVSMTAETLQQSPSIDEHKPVSREYEETLFQYFGYGYYWIGPGAWGDFAHPGELADGGAGEQEPESDTPKPENHLRACGEINGYDVQTSDGDLGHVCDFVFDTTDWALRLVVIDTRNWLPGGKKVVVTPTALRVIDWSSHKVDVAMDQNTLQNQPEFDAGRLAEEGYLQSLIEKA